MFRYLHRRRSLSLSVRNLSRASQLRNRNRPPHLSLPQCKKEFPSKLRYLHRRRRLSVRNLSRASQLRKRNGPLHLSLPQ
ncbi:MAG: hypothetical protein ABSE73_22010 [Planctomycetota bacterium]